MSHSNLSQWNADREALIVADASSTPGAVLVVSPDGSVQSHRLPVRVTDGEIRSAVSTFNPFDQVLRARPTAEARRGRRSPTLLTALTAAAMAMGCIAPGIDRISPDLPDSIPLPAPGKRRRLFKPKVKGACGKCGKKRRNCRC